MMIRAFVIASLATTLSIANAHADPCGGYESHRSWSWHGGRPKGRIGIGVATGTVGVDGDREGRQKAVLGRVALHRGFEVELEFARADIGDGVARTAGAAITKSFGRRRLRPFFAVGGGGGVADRDDGSEPRLHYREIGGGLMFRKRRLGLAVDVRAGVRTIEGTPAGEMPPATSTLGIVVVTPDPDDEDARYVRGRIMALIYF